MTRELEAARFAIEQMLLEHGAVCMQIDAVVCHNQTDVMCYVYEESGAYFTVLVELPGEVGYFDPLDWEQRLWPRPTSQVLH